jgi:hypothetical protein
LVLLEGMAWLREWIVRYGHQIWVGRDCSVSQPPFTSAIHQRHSPEIRGKNARELPKFAMTAMIADESDESHSQPRSCYILFGIIWGISLQSNSFRIFDKN